MRQRQRQLVYAIVLACIASDATAQDTTSVREGWIVGALVGVPGAGSEIATEALTLGVGATRLVPNRPGIDLAVGSVPRFLADGLLVLGARAGIGIPIGLTRDLYLVPSAGLSAIGGFGTGGGGGTGGLYAGAATVLTSGSRGFRAGVTLHRYGGEPMWLVEIGLMRVPLPSPRRSRARGTSLTQ